MRRALLPSAILAVSLAACAGTAPATTATTTILTAQAKLRAAVTLYGISKGIAEVAAIADPGLAPVLNTVVATLDPLVAQAQPALAAPSDAMAIESLANTISVQANALTLVAAPVIKVVPAS